MQEAEIDSSQRSDSYFEVLSNPELPTADAAPFPLSVLNGMVLLTAPHATTNARCL